MAHEHWNEPVFSFDDAAADTRGLIPVPKILAAIAHEIDLGNVERAARIYEEMGAKTSYDLLEQARAGDKERQRRYAEMLAKARDFKNAAALYEGAGAAAQAAIFYEQCGDFAAAGRCHERTGNGARAAAAYGRAGMNDKALELHRHLGPSETLGELLGQIGRHYQAGEIYRQVGAYPAALEMYHAIPMDSPERIAATLGMVVCFRAGGPLDAAVPLLLETIKQAPEGKTDRSLHEALVAVLLELGRNDHAEQVRQRMFRLSSRMTQVASSRVVDQIRAATAAPRPTGLLAPPGARPSTPLPRPTTSVSPPASTSAPAPRPTTAAALLTSPDAYKYLKEIPIFAELQMEEMKSLYRLAKKTIFPPESVVIEQGQTGRGLVVLVDGEVRILRVAPDGSARELAREGPGAFLGEMTLFDDQPTSARVVTDKGASTLVISRERFGEFLYAHDSAALKIYKLFTNTLIERLRKANERR